jgi:hypothetical protein
VNTCYLPLPTEPNQTGVCLRFLVFCGLKVTLLVRIVQQATGRWLPRAAPLMALGLMVAYALLAGASAAGRRSLLP